MKMNFEIYVSKIDDKYQAVCPAFPGCVGEGDTETEATEDLGNVITMHLSDTVRHTIDDVRQLGLLRRVSALPLDIDIPAEKLKKPSRSKPEFPLDAQDLFGKIMFSGKLPISPELIRKLDKKQMGMRLKKIMGIGGLPSMLDMPALFEDIQLPFQTELAHDNLMFGVPMSLN
jgi:predicted RNase H-like HicB family nuclease